MDNQKAWSDVAVGDFVQDKNGDVWEVRSHQASGATVTVSLKGSRDVAGVKVPATGTVAVIFSTTRGIETAVALAQVHLGGKVAAKPQPDGTYMCPLDYADMGTMCAHLYIMHGVTSGAVNLLAANAEHVKLHDGLLTVQHVHTPHFGRN